MDSWVTQLGEYPKIGGSSGGSTGLLARLGLVVEPPLMVARMEKGSRKIVQQQVGRVVDLDME